MCRNRDNPCRPRAAQRARALYLKFGQMHAMGAHAGREPRVTGNENDETARATKPRELSGAHGARRITVMTENNASPARQPRDRRGGVRKPALIGHKEQGGQTRRPRYAIEAPCRCC
jgi:hypothetical protein